MSKTLLQLTNPNFGFNEQLLKNDIKFFRRSGSTQAFIRRRVVFAMDGYRYAHAAAQKRWGVKFVFYETGHKPVKRVYYSADLNRQTGILWLSELKKDQLFGQRLINELREVITIEQKLAKEIAHLPQTREAATEALWKHLAWWVKFFELAHLWFAVDFIKEETDAKIRKVWKGTSNALMHFLEHVYRPVQLPMSSREERELLQVAKLPKAVREEALEEHTLKYRHLSLRGIDDEYFDIEYYRGRLRPLLDPIRYTKQKNAFEAADREITKADSLLASVSIDEKLKERVELVRWFMYLRTESVDYMNLVAGAYKPTFEFLSGEFGIPIEAVLNMTYKEIFDSLDTGKLVLEKEVILDRLNNGYGYFIGPEHSVLVTGKDIDRLEKACFPAKKKEIVKELKGQSAFKGKVRAPARVILDKRNAGELKEGEILVTTMTMPDFVPAMKISSGIITNEGGVLCHAAIMSRELRKPCIIGTKIATDVIKTGQMVTLDADTGMVIIE